MKTYKKKSKKVSVVSADTVKKILRHIGRYKFSMIFSLIFGTVFSLGSLYIPIAVGKVIDLIIAPGKVDFDGITPYLIVIASVAVAAGVSRWAMNTLNNRVSYNVMRDLRNESFDKIEKLPIYYLDESPSGDILSRVIADVDQFSDGLLIGFGKFFTGVIQIVGTLYFMFSINWKIAVTVVVLTPISLVTANFISGRSYSSFVKQSEIRGEQTGFINEIIENQKTVKAFSQEKNENDIFNEINDRLGVISLKAQFFSSITNPSTRFINAIVYAAVALFGALAVLGNPFFTVGTKVFTVGGMSAFLSYANEYTKPFNDISSVVAELQNAFACAARVFKLTDDAPEISEKPQAGELTDAKGRVDIENVSFSYDKSKKLIENFSVSVKPGQKIAIVGPTGCGKTTMINLLMRFYSPDKGKICLDSNDIEYLTRQSVRRNYGMVLQDTWLQNGTVKENISFGKPGASDSEIIAAAKKAHADSFIRRLPNGYDTYISSADNSLSQGQKQLLCIARVMMLDPKILILDEATSSIDTRTELQIQDAFNIMMEGKTAFIVAHRLSTVRNADMIIVMKDGKIIETGTHTELLEKGGFYSELYNSQFEGVAD